MRDSLHEICNEVMHRYVRYVFQDETSVRLYYVSLTATFHFAAAKYLKQTICTGQRPEGFP